MAKKTKNFNIVSVRTDKGSLRLQFPVPLVRALNAQGIDFDRYKPLRKREIDPITGKSNRPWAEAIAARIQADLDHPDGLFDYTLAKYLTIRVADANGDVNTLSMVTSAMTLGQLWDEFLEYHTAGLGESTRHYYESDCGKKITLYRERVINLDTANAIRNDFLKQQNLTVKKTLSLLESAVDWAITQDKIALLKNPFKGLSKGIKVTRRVNKLTDSPDKFVAFSEDEVIVILNTFLHDQVRSKYYPFFRFKFMTGCRTGEAIALTWDDIKFDQSDILFNKTCSEKTGVTKGTKTEDCRIFPMTDSMKDWLQSLQASSSSQLVFPGNGNNHLVRSTIDKAWGNNRSTESSKGRLGIAIALAKQNKIAQYLPMYNTRHTFINACIERGVDTITIAGWCGNSDRIIEQVYRSRNRNVDINKQLPMF